MATDVKAARGNGCSGALPFLAMVTVTGAEYIVISAPSQQQAHSEVFHLSVFIVGAAHHASGRRTKAEIINAGKGSERQPTPCRCCPGGTLGTTATIQIKQAAPIVDIVISACVSWRLRNSEGETGHL